METEDTLQPLQKPSLLILNQVNPLKSISLKIHFNIIMYKFVQSSRIEMGRRHEEDRAGSG
jgi:hypothetical protein